MPISRTTNSFKVFLGSSTRFLTGSCSCLDIRDSAVTPFPGFHGPQSFGHRVEVVGEVEGL